MSDKRATSFGVRIKEIRDLLGWTQEEMADRIGIGAQEISFYETGERPWPSVPRLIQIADALGMKTDALLGRGVRGWEGP